MPIQFGIQTEPIRFAAAEFETKIPGMRALRPSPPRARTNLAHAAMTLALIVV
jgi:hypothetical protein